MLEWMNFLSHISAIQVSGIIQSFPYPKYWCSTHQQVEGAVFIVSYFHPLTHDQAPSVVWKLQCSPLCPGPACSRLDRTSSFSVYLIQPQTKGMVTLSPLFYSSNSISATPELTQKHPLEVASLSHPKPKNSAPLNTNTTVETQIGSQKSGFPLTLTAINKAYFLLSITF